MAYYNIHAESMSFQRCRKWQRWKQRKSNRGHLNDRQICTSTPRKSKVYFDQRRLLNELPSSSTSVESLNHCPKTEAEEAIAAFKGNQKNNSEEDDDLLYTETPTLRAGHKLRQRRRINGDNISQTKRPSKVQLQSTKPCQTLPSAPMNLTANKQSFGVEENALKMDLKTPTVVNTIVTTTTSTGTSSDWRQSTRGVPLCKRLYRRQKRERGPRPSIHANSQIIRNQQRSNVITSTYEQLLARSRKQRLEYLNQLRNVNQHFVHQVGFLEFVKNESRIKERYSGHKDHHLNYYEEQKFHGGGGDGDCDRKLYLKLKQFRGQPWFRKSITKHLHAELLPENGDKKQRQENYFRKDNSCWTTAESDSDNESNMSCDSPCDRFNRVLAGKISAAPFQVNTLDFQSKGGCEKEPIDPTKPAKVLLDDGLFGESASSSTTITLTASAINAANTGEQRMGNKRRTTCFTVYGGKCLYNRCLPYIDNVRNGGRRSSSLLTKSHHARRKRYSVAFHSSARRQPSRNGFGGKQLHLVNDRAITLLDLLQMWHQMDATSHLIICLVALGSFTALLSLVISLMSRKTQ